MDRLDGLPLDLLGEILSKLNPKSLAIMRCVDKSIYSHISNDPYLKSNVKGSIPSPEFAPSMSSAMEVDEKMVDVMEVDHDDDKPNNSGLGMIMSMIGKISPYNWLVEKKETRVGKRSLIEDDETTLMKMDVESSHSYKLMNMEERINKRRRVNSYACN